MRKVTAEQAFEDYVALGPGRSIRKLDEQYQNNSKVRAPSVGTLMRWSGQHQWQAKLAEHNEKVAEQVQDKLAKTEAAERWDAVQACRDAARDAMKRGVEMLTSVEGKNGADVKAIFDTAINLLGKADVLEGGVSNRTEDHSRPDYGSMLGHFETNKRLGEFRRKAEANKAKASEATAKDPATAKDRDTVPEGDDDQ